MQLSDNGQVYTFGNGFNGRLGDGDTGLHFRGTPYLVSALDGIFITGIDASATHSIVVSDDGKVYTFGSGSNGKLGDGNSNTHDVGLPTYVSALNGTHVKSVSAGYAHSMVLTCKK